MSLAKIAGRMTLRGVVLIVILLVVMINGAHAQDSDPGRWVYDLFRHSVGVTLNDDGSGFAVGPEGEMIHFCVDGAPCDDVPTIVVTRRRPIH